MRSVLLLLFITDDCLYCSIRISVSLRGARSNCWGVRSRNWELLRVLFLWSPMGGRCCCSDCKSTWDLGLARCCCCCIMCLLFRPGCSMLSRMASLTCDWWKITLLTQGSASAPSSSSGVLMALASARRERDTVTLSTSYVDMFLIAEEWLVLQKDSSFFQLLKKSYVAQRTGIVFGHSTQPFLSKPGKYIYLDYHSKKKATYFLSPLLYINQHLFQTSP